MPLNPSADMYQPILGSQANLLAEAATEHGWDLASFESSVHEEVGAESTRLLHRSSGYYFDVSSVQLQFSVRYSPGLTSRVVSAQYGAFEPVLGAFKDWLGFLSREVDIDDRWQTAGEWAAEPIWDSEMELPISQVEAAEFASAIPAAGEYLTSVGVEEAIAVESVRLLEEMAGSLREIAASNQRLSRRQAHMWIAGAVLSIGTAASLDGSQMSTLFEMIVSGIRMLAGG